MTDFSIIACVDSNYGISLNSALPWSKTDEGRNDMKWFAESTANSIVIMGRKTYESIGQPLKNRTHIIISRTQRDLEYIDECKIIYVTSFNSALIAAAYEKTLGIRKVVPHVWVIGGAQIYKQALLHPHARSVHINHLLTDYGCDLQFPEELLKRFEYIDDGLYNIAVIYIRRNTEELTYCDLLRDLQVAPVRPNRTGTNTHGLFSRVLRFNLYDPMRGPIMPLLTVKRVPYKLVVSELLWFIGGKCTDISYLHKHNNHIWDDNTTREFLDSRGLAYEAGNCGPIYGFQWRHWGVDIKEMMESGRYNADELDDSIGGYDQLSNVIETLKTDPYDRRMVVSCWNPDMLEHMALPPCHWSFQFHVTPLQDSLHSFALNCSVNMRSADVALGVPFNIASYATLVHIIAHIVNMRPGEITINMTDCHSYSNHEDGIETMLARDPRLFPTFKFDEALSHASPALTIDDFAKADPSQFIITDYCPYPGVKLKMAI
jgi:thymidylate synthase